MPISISQLPVLSDNYIYILRDDNADLTAVVDPAETAPVVDFLKEKKWSLNFVINTHHHWDHVGGNLELKKKYGAKIVGPRQDAERIPGIDESLGDGDTFVFGSDQARVFDTPGHTKGHIVYYFENSRALFCGDTLFSLGCGRLFEGTPNQMWKSLSKLKDLPSDTLVYCAHEYTQANGEFALTVDPKNLELQAMVRDIAEKRQNQKPTVPSVLGDEFECNPFLRADQHSIREALGKPTASDVEVFAEIRKRKDNF